MNPPANGDHAVHRCTVILVPPNKALGIRRATHYCRCLAGCGFVGPERASAARSAQDGDEHQRAMESIGSYERADG